MSATTKKVTAVAGSVAVNSAQRCVVDRSAYAAGSGQDDGVLRSRRFVTTRGHRASIQAGGGWGGWAYQSVAVEPHMPAVVAAMPSTLAMRGVMPR